MFDPEEPAALRFGMSQVPKVGGDGSLHAMWM
jgi:hypothetical protein